MYAIPKLNQKKKKTWLLLPLLSLSLSLSLSLWVRESVDYLLNCNSAQTETLYYLVLIPPAKQSTSRSHC